MLDAQPTGYVHHDTGACSHLLALFAREDITAQTITGESSSGSGTLKRFERVIRWSSSKAEQSGSLRAIAGQTDKKHKKVGNCLLTASRGLTSSQKASPACTGCGHTLLRPFACLACDFVGCPPVTMSVSFGNSHTKALACLKNHMTGTGHEFGMIHSILHRFAADVSEKVSIRRRARFIVCNAQISYTATLSKPLRIG